MKTVRPVLLFLSLICSSHLFAASFFGTVTVPECTKSGAGAQICDWTYQADSTLCNKGCSKLVIYFSGGQMTCPTENMVNSYLAKFASKGYVAICARIFESPDDSGRFPFHEEAKRVNAIVRSIRGDSNIKELWDGRHLLFSGVSHGATAPVIAMARTDFDSTPAWKGREVTAACFMDGVYDAMAQLNFSKDNKCGGTFTYKRAFSRYCPWTGGINPSTWPDPSSCVTPNIRLDTVTKVDPRDLAIKQWKLFECGSGLPACTGDGPPAPPIQAFCNHISASPGRGCSFESFPTTTHMKCGNTPEIIESCQTWFESQIGR